MFVKKIIDKNGLVIPGMLRDANGAIIIDNSVAEEEYNNKKKLFDRVSKLEDSLVDLNKKMDLIVSKLLSTH